MKYLYKEAGRTVRQALEAWGPTLRLMALMMVAAIIVAGLLALKYYTAQWLRPSQG